MVRRLPAGSSRRHPRTDACCGVMNAMLGPTLRDVLAVAHRNETMGDRTGELLASNGETHRKLTFTGPFRAANLIEGNRRHPHGA
jgi:hypothetical protein